MPGRYAVGDRRYGHHRLRELLRTKLPAVDAKEQERRPWPYQLFSENCYFGEWPQT